MLNWITVEIYSESITTLENICTPLGSIYTYICMYICSMREVYFIYFETRLHHWIRFKPKSIYDSRLYTSPCSILSGKCISPVSLIHSLSTRYSAFGHSYTLEHIYFTFPYRMLVMWAIVFFYSKSKVEQSWTSMKQL